MSNVIDIVVKAKDETKGGFSSADKGASSLGAKVGKAGKVAAAGLVAMGAAAVGATLKAEEVASANSRVANVLGNMGMDKATDRALAYAESLEMSLGVDEKVIKNTQAKLGTFSELAKSADEAGGAFDRATVAAVDMAAAGFGDAESNAVQLGKALQDPIKGITALNKSGVTFTEQQKKQIKTMVEAGDTAGAQSMILAELEKQVGGTAEATGDSSEKMKLAFGNVVETIGASLLPHMDKLAAIVQQVAGVMEENSSVVLIAGGVLAGLAVSVIAVNAAMKVYRAGVIVATAAQWALNSALLANPIGLVVLALAAIAAAVVVAYKKSETFRAIVDKMWAGLKQLGGWLAGAAVAQWGAFKKAIDAVAKAGKWLWDKALRPTFRFIVNGVAGLLDMWAAMLRALSKVPGFGWAKGAADAMSGAAAKARGLANDIRGIPNKTVKVTVEYGSRGEIPAGFGPIHTPRKAAHGGIGGGLTMVGERGRELVRLPHGSTVIPNGTTENMMAAGGGGRTVIELRSSGSRVDDMLLELLRNAIRVRGGNVQIVLGRA